MEIQIVLKFIQIFVECILGNFGSCTRIRTIATTRTLQAEALKSPKVWPLLHSRNENIYDFWSRVDCLHIAKAY